MMHAMCCVSSTILQCVFLLHTTRILLLVLMNYKIWTLADLLGNISAELHDMQITYTTLSY